jgi:hypothetical protein
MQIPAKLKAARDRLEKRFRGREIASVGDALEFGVPNTVLGFAGELGLGGTAGLSAGLIPLLEVPIIELGFAGELGFVGTEGVPAALPDWVASCSRSLELHLDLRANSDLWAPKECLPCRRPDCLHLGRCERQLGVNRGR